MKASFDSVLEAGARRDRWIVAALIVLVVAVSWAYLLSGAGMGMSAIDMTRMSQAAGSPSMPAMTPIEWTRQYAVLMFFMWWIMMVAMMLPSAAPMILLFATLNRKQRESGNPHVSTGLFVLGYLGSWAVFSLIAVPLQWGFSSIGIISPTLIRANSIFGAILLLAAGLYQLSPLKHACLRHCRSPLTFLSTRWQKGAGGALRMGFSHGAYCVGCCFFLMGLLFFGGAMNLYWIAGLALFVLLEKTLPAGHWLASLTGIALLITGTAILLSAI